MTFEEVYRHHTIQLSPDDRKWLKDIMRAMCSQSLTHETALLAIELAFKKGYVVGAAETRKGTGRDR